MSPQQRTWIFGIITVILAIFPAYMMIHGLCENKQWEAWAFALFFVVFFGGIGVVMHTSTHRPLPSETWAKKYSQDSKESSDK